MNKAASDLAKLRWSKMTKKERSEQAKERWSKVPTKRRSAMVGRNGGRPRQYPPCPRYSAHRFSKSGRCPCGYTRAVEVSSGTSARDKRRETHR
jgi:hypothetical protein